MRLAPVTLLLLASTACVTADGASDTTVATTIQAPATRLFLSALAGDSDRARPALIESPAGTAALIDRAVPEGHFTELAAWEYGLDAPLADPLVTVSLTLAPTDELAVRWRLVRTDSCGGFRAASAYVDVGRPAGRHLGSIRFVTDWRSGDRLVLSLEARRLDPDGSDLLQLTVGTTASFVDLGPGVDRAVAEADGAGSVTAATVLGSVVGSGELALTDATRLPAGDFRWNNQRTIWWNGHAGRWDTVLPTAAPPAAAGSDWWLWTDLAGDPQPVKQMATRPSSPDIYWDDAVCELSVFFSRDASGTSRFNSYTYDPYADTYLPRFGESGLPVAMRGSRRVTIMKSPNGHLWAGVNHELGVRVMRSVDGGATWAEPVVLRSTVARGDNHWVVFEEGKRTRVGLAVTEDGGDVLFLSIDQDDVFWADARRWRDESHLIPGHQGSEMADDELSAVALGGEVFIVIETELGSTSRSDGLGLPQLVVYHRAADGSWFKRVLAAYGAEPGDDLKRPTIGANRETGQIHVGVSRSDRTASYILSASLVDLETWEPYPVFTVRDPGSQSLYNMRLPRQPVDLEIGLPVLVVEQASGRLWRQLVIVDPTPAAESD